MSHSMFCPFHSSPKTKANRSIKTNPFITSSIRNLILQRNLLLASWTHLVRCVHWVAYVMQNRATRTLLSRSPRCTQIAREIIRYRFCPYHPNTNQQGWYLLFYGFPLFACELIALFRQCSRTSWSRTTHVPWRCPRNKRYYYCCYSSLSAKTRILTYMHATCEKQMSFNKINQLPEGPPQNPASSIAHKPLTSLYSANISMKQVDH